MLDKIQGYSGSFTSKRGTYWNYHISYSGWIDQWHPNTVRCTGGWKTGSDTHSPTPTKECFEHIEKTFGFKPDPDCEWAVIITWHNPGDEIAKYNHRFGGPAVAYRMADGRIRLVEYSLDKMTAHLIREFNSMDEVEEELDLTGKYTYWTKE